MELAKASVLFADITTGLAKYENNRTNMYNYMTELKKDATTRVIKESIDGIDKEDIKYERNI